MPLSGNYGLNLPVYQNFSQVYGSPQVQPAMGAVGGFGGIASGVGALTGLSALGPIGTALGGLTSAASGIYGLIMGGRRSQAEKMSQSRWELTQPTAGRIFQQTFYAPQAEGLMPPYPRGEQYHWAPSQAMRNIYASYLNRQYQMPQSVARAMSAQALSPLQLGRIPGNMASPAMIHRTLMSNQAYNPQMVAQSYLAKHIPAVQNKFSQLQTAAELAQFNLWRAQMLPYLLG